MSEFIICLDQRSLMRRKSISVSTFTHNLIPSHTILLRTEIFYANFCRNWPSKYWLRIIYTGSVTFQLYDNSEQACNRICSPAAIEVFNEDIALGYANCSYEANDLFWELYPAKSFSTVITSPWCQNALQWGFKSRRIAVDKRQT